MRHGTLLIFKEGVTVEEAERRLSGISDILEDGDQLHTREPGNCGFIEAFDPEQGWPVWYIP